MTLRILLRKLALTPVWLYRYCLSPFMPKNCRFYPTCSAYACEAVMAHGLGRGGLLALLRLLRCHPWHPGGYDPVPPARDFRCQRRVKPRRKGARPPRPAGASRKPRFSGAAIFTPDRQTRRDITLEEMLKHSWKPNVLSLP